MKKNNFKSLMQAAVLICTPLAIASCDDVFGDVDNPIPSYMSIKEADVTLVLHKDSLDKATYTRTATAATGAEIVYSSTKPEIATVDAKTGKITAVSGGECEIIAEATGKDSHGNMTYQPQKSSFKVKVTDYRARIALKEGVEIPVYNSALASTAEPIALKDILDVWPALDTKGLTVTYTVTEADPLKPVIKSTASNEITLNDQVGVAKVTAKIADGDVPKGFEQKSFSKSQETAEFTIEVKQGVAYISGYDAEGKPDTTYMFKDYNGEKYTLLSDALKANDKDVYLKAGWYYLDKDVTFGYNIRVEGDVNIILGDGADLFMAGKDIMDESAKQSYKMNIFPAPKMTGTMSTLKSILDFKEINLYGGEIGDIVAVEDVNIINGTAGDMEGTGTANITDAVTGSVYGFATANIIGSNTSNLWSIETLNIKSGTVAAANMSSIGTATISDGTITATSISAVALNVAGGKVTVDDDIRLGKSGAGKLTMTGGELKVGDKLSGNSYAVYGSVEVTKGDFTASSKDYHAVSGTLTGKFYGKTTADGKWAEIKATESSNPYITTIAPKE